MCVPGLPPLPHCCRASNGGRPGISLRMGDPANPSRSLGEIRLVLRPEWTASAYYAERVAAVPAARQQSTIYRLEPGFLIQGRLHAGGVAANKETRRAPKVMERGEVGWAGGSAGPDFFIYLGTGPASWLGNPHEGTIFAEVADEESMAVAANVSLLPMGYTPPGQMHILKSTVQVTPRRWVVPEGALDQSLNASARVASAAASGTSATSAAPAIDADDNGRIVPLGLLKIANTASDQQAASCPSSCHALSHTELHGSVVKWGETHIKEDAAACCRACEEHAARTGGAARHKCNVWVYCGSEARCGKRYKQCWLKNAKDLWSDTKLLVGTSDAWTSGTSDAAPFSHPSGAGRSLPTANQAEVVFEISPLLHPVVAVRLRLRADAAPRAAELVRRMLTRSPQHAGSSGTAACAESGGPRLLAATGVPNGYGMESLQDGIGAGERWPRGVGMLRFTFGGTLVGSSAPSPSSSYSSWYNSTDGKPTAVEPDPVLVKRGSIAWAVPGGDGPVFFIALADMPQLGVSLTVWGEVVSEDLPVLDALAKEAEEVVDHSAETNAGTSLHAKGLRLPAAVSISRAPGTR